MIKLTNTGKRGMTVGDTGSWCSPGQEIEVSDDIDLSKLEGSFKVVGKKLKEPIKANLKEEVKYGSKQ